MHRAGQPDQTGLVRVIAARYGVPLEALHILAGREDRIVARVSTPDGFLLAKADATPGAFQHEAAAMETLRELGLPVSEVIAIEPGPPALLVATWADGIPISAATPRAILVQVGVILQTIHEQPAGPPFSGHASIRDWLDNWLHALLPWWAAMGNVPAAAVARAEAWLERSEPLLAEREGRLMLFDGRPDHFLVDDRSVLQMIDVADLQPGDPAMDLAVLDLDAPGILDGVLEGYAPSPGEAATLERLAPLYAFLRALSGAEWLTRVKDDTDAAERYLQAASERLDRHG